MPCEYSADRQRRLVRIVVRGAATMEERSSCVCDILDDSSLGTDFDVLINSCAASVIPEESNVSQLVLLNSMLQEKFSGKIALVASQVGYTLIKSMVAIEGDKPGHPMRSFTDEASALAWLGKS